MSLVGLGRPVAIYSLSALPGAALAHGEHAMMKHGHDGFLLAVALSAAAILYGIGAIRLRRRGRPRHLADLPQIVMVAAGLIILGATLSPPVHELAGELVSVHMVQHLLLMLVAAPLIIWSRFLPIVVFALPARARRTIARVWKAYRGNPVAGLLGRPATAWLAFSGTIALWHLPALYRVAERDAGLHVLMNLSFFGAALLFWSVVIEPSGRRRLDLGRTILFVFSTAMVTGLPGALLSFAQRPIYHDPSAAIVFGLTPLEDQRLAGLIMWIPMDLILFGVAAALFAAWLSRIESRQLVDA